MQRVEQDGGIHIANSSARAIVI